jgi:hypothetical protein
MNIDSTAVRKCLKAFDFTTLFREHLGWDVHEAHLEIPVEGDRFKLNAVAEKRGFVAYLCEGIPTRAVRMKIDRVVTKSSREHFIIYSDQSQGLQVWQWVRREAGKPLTSRDHRFDSRRTGDALIQRLEKVAIALDEEDSLSLVDVAGRTRAAFDVEKVTKKFYERFRTEHKAFQKLIDGIDLDGDREWYASLMLNRLMFVYFIQKKGFLDSDTEYLRNRLKRVQEIRGQDHFQSFYRFFLLRMFHDGLGKSPADRRLNRDLEKLLGKVPYLNGGFFELHPVEKRHTEIDIPDEAFARLFDFFDEFAWHLDERPLKDGNEIDPDVLGYIFEKYINQKQMGAYYTREDITEYICKNTIIPFLFDAAKKKCPIAFTPGSFLWQLLRDDPDRYIYSAVRHGVVDAQGQIIALPKEIEAGIKHVSKRELWNLAASDRYALPTETWREYVARRQHCLELRQRLARGDIHTINELITLNLDIWQFARDAIVNSEGPELLRAFWHAIAGRIPEKSNEKFEPGITVLDPTCGSGAFLFSALRVLETLYSDCLQAMSGFLDEPEAPPAPDIRLRALIAGGENDRCEFKSTMRHCIKTAEAVMPEDRRKEVLKAKDKERNHDVLKSVAAMLNSSGGDVIVGVRDDGSPYGVENDYQYFSKEADRNPDGYELWLRQHLVNHFGVVNSPNIRAQFVKLDGKTVLWLRVFAARQACYVTSDSRQKLFFIRNGNETRALDTEEVVAYHATRFSSEAMKQLPGPSPEPIVRPAKKRRGDDFRSVLAKIKNHPNERYFILKSIIINNLFGVDIMDEAVEICKLRLFLKLVSQVDVIDQLEPLPDIDFNIRSGNALIGYVDLDEIRRARSGERKGNGTQRRILDTEDDKEIKRIEEDALAIERSFRQFREQQTLHEGVVDKKAKNDLLQRLTRLGGVLDITLASEYGRTDFSNKREKTHDLWKRTHQPFHWFIEFNGVVGNGGFSVIVGNPPWKEYASIRNTYQVRNFIVESCGNLHGLCTERALQIRGKEGRLGFIVQLPLTSSSRMSRVRELLFHESELMAVCSFDDRPGKLFDGLEHCRSVIFLSESNPGGKPCSLFTTRYLRWKTEARDSLFATMQFTESVDTSMHSGVIAKIGCGTLLNALRQFVENSNAILGDFISGNRDNPFVFYQEATQYWVKAILGLPFYEKDGMSGPPAHGRFLHLKNSNHAKVSCAILNSSLFYLYFIAYGDCFHLSETLVSRFPVSRALMEDRELGQLGQDIDSMLKSTAVRKRIKTRDGSGIIYAEFRGAKCKSVIDKIDERIGKLHGLDLTAIDEIRSFDIKFRLGSLGGEEP